MTLPPRVLALLILCGTLPRSGPAQREYGAPEAVAVEVLRADSLHDWRLLLALAHPDALRQYRHDQVRMLNDDDLSGFPEMDSCSTAQLRKYHRFLLDSVFRTPSPESLSQLPSDTVFARVQRFMARSRGLRASVDSFAPTRSILGHVMADDSTAYVVLEERYAHRPFPDWPTRRAEIMTFRLYGAAWRTMLDPHLGQGLGSVMFGGDDCR
jgi:hypothetical protein